MFNKVQILSCLIITLGVVLNTLPEDWYRIILKFFYNHTHIHADKSSYPPLDPQFYIGVLLLISSTVLLAVMGLYNEKIHKKYGNQWKESLFYTHFLGLPLFMFVYPKITLEFLQIWNDRDVYQSFPIVSKQFINLGLNVISQFFCIKGVNVLVGSTLALSVIIILLIRKFISFFISILWFGHELTINGMVGGSMVLIGAAIYSVAGQTKRRKKGKNNKSYINLKKLSDDEKVKEKQPIVNQKTE